MAAFGFGRARPKTPRRSQARSTVEIAGVLHVNIGNATIDIVADGPQVRAEINDFATCEPTLRLVLSVHKLARRLSIALESRALMLIVLRHGRSVVELGSGVNGGALMRLLALPRVRLVRGRR
jgi:hypothetical protein